MIKLPIKLGSARVDGVLIHDDVVKGGYKVVQSIDERNALEKTGTLTVGSPVYVSNESTTYRWNGSTWVEEVIDIPTNTSELTNDSGFITAKDIPAPPTVPTKTSELTNDSGFITADDIPESSDITIDEVLDPGSKNPVQNKVVTMAIGELRGMVTGNRGLTIHLTNTVYSTSTTNIKKEALVTKNDGTAPSVASGDYILDAISNLFKVTSLKKADGSCYVVYTQTLNRGVTIHKTLSLLITEDNTPGDSITVAINAITNGNAVFAGDLILEGNYNLLQITTINSDNTCDVRYLGNILSSGGGGDGSSSSGIYRSLVDGDPIDLYFPKVTITKDPSWNGADWDEEVIEWQDIYTEGDHYDLERDYPPADYKGKLAMTNEGYYKCDGVSWKYVNVLTQAEYNNLCDPNVTATLKAVVDSQNDMFELTGVVNGDKCIALDFPAIFTYNSSTGEWVPTKAWYEEDAFCARVKCTGSNIYYVFDGDKWINQQNLPKGTVIYVEYDHTITMGTYKRVWTGTHWELEDWGTCIDYSETISKTNVNASSITVNGVTVPDGYGYVTIRTLELGKTFHSHFDGAYYTIDLKVKLDGGVIYTRTNIKVGCGISEYWNNVFEYSDTNPIYTDTSFAISDINIDNNVVKAGDFVIDISGKLYHIISVNENTCTAALMYSIKNSGITLFENNNGVTFANLIAEESSYTFNKGLELGKRYIAIFDEPGYMSFSGSSTMKVAYNGTVMDDSNGILGTMIHFEVPYGVVKAGEYYTAVVGLQIGNDVSGKYKATAGDCTLLTFKSSGMTTTDLMSSVRLYKLIEY